MKKTIFFFLTLFCTQNMLAQKNLDANDWVKILSGNIATYQEYNIKTLNLYQNNKIIKRIDYHSVERKITANGEKDSVTYLFDKNNRMTAVYFPQESYFLNYHDANVKANFFQLKKDEDSLQITQTISFPYPEKQKIEWLEIIKKSKKTGKTVFSSSEKYILNPKDSLWNYEESRTNKNFYRRYYNGASSQLRYVSEKEYSYDSTYVRPNGIRFSKYEQMKNDSLWRHISVGDSVYNYHYKSGKLYQKQIRFEDNLKNEYNYNPETGKLMETIAYTYFPENEYGGIVLWKKEYHNLETQKTEITFPNKKNFKLRNNVLIERKKWKWNLFKKIFPASEILGCGTTSHSVHTSKSKRLPYYIYNIASTSILVDNYFLIRNLDDYEFSDSFIDDDINQSFIHSEISLADFQKSTFSGVYKTGTVPRDIRNEMQRISKRFVRKMESYKYYKLEIITHDNEKFECEPYQHFNQIQLPIDVFIYRGDL
ncbi:hypothetical protein J2X31_003646 [Flavobacterium arsenatis]|uniref:Uncharacterized protein n=1 Tax=Flavobacterium arsenatis TaxID=1484332 RepID=A0ABU1TUQ6_9FLAO|nr:hypothetical protein [Flavobacterium arsenatis]MDR6969613.1 hypothetical protein [Flavobacterium arsenatis]